MTPRQQQIINMIENNLSLNEMLKELNITDRALLKSLNTLKNNGLNIFPKFAMSGKHSLEIRKDIPINYEIEPTIIEKSHTFKVLAISDTHLLNKEESLEKINKAYSFAKSKGINYVFHMGDFIDSKLPNISRETYLDKAKKKIMEYPNYNSMTTFVVLGNHDLEALEAYGINISNLINSLRTDLICFSEDYGVINIGNLPILLFHKFPPCFIKEQSPEGLILKGHSHKHNYENYINKRKKLGALVTVPSLSNMIMKGYEQNIQRGFDQIEFDLLKETDSSYNVDSFTINQYEIDDSNKITKLNEIKHKVLKLK